MSSVRRFTREEWEPKLRSLGCYPQDGLTKLNTAEWWRWPFPATPFTVPVDCDGCLDQAAYFRLMADMAQLAPEGWEFSDPFNMGE